MWRIKQLSTIIVMWMMLLVVLFLTHNIGHNIMKNPLHHTEREVQPQANSSETPLDENRLEQGYHDEDESEIGRTMKERRERIKSVCKKYQPYNNVRNTLTFRDYYFHNFDITVCLIAKSGSSTWRRHLRHVNGGPPENIGLEKDVYRINMLKLPDNDLIAKVNSSTKIITVRHPLTRLASCYRQKFRDGGTLKKYSSRQDENKLKRTAGASWQQLIYSFWVPVLHTNHMLPPDFHQRLGLEKPFDPKIMYDVHVYQKLRAILMPKISFAQFIRHVVATFEINKADAHWKDYTSECSPCYFDYQYVTKLEYMTQELDYVFKKFGIPSDPEFAYNTKRSTLTDFTSDYEYYRNVPLDLRKKIYEIFKLDMEMFDYKLPPWFLNNV